jgi:hypothetical protein
VEHLKRVLIEKCLPQTQEIWLKRTMEEVWKFLDNAYVQPDTFFHDLMLPVTTAIEVSEKD